MNAKLLALPLIVLGLAAAQPALAHGNTRPQHGGVVLMAGETVFELVTKAGAVALYVTDDDEPVKATDMSGDMTISAGGKTQLVPLKPADGNRFDAPGATIPANARVAVQVKDKATQTSLGTTFTLN
ncbi:hypothetical protein [Nitrospirillum sp. BR 11163]|uniref:hypothetical protein n=1 Tax=Nitrospirillum sp. BR 11163 TaxID=3104323 RepID=UPI002AFF6B04|nr:hypothetical protein [Nitrospirillum sp. BR 11163]MEA1671980.1 hypothetical protein [Nitrospirillum sp. BR 11163]